MKHKINRPVIILLTAVMAFLLAACEDYSEWEKRTAAEKTEVPVIPPADTGYTGPSLADYVNAGIEEAKENGYYTETDYSDITDDTIIPENPPVSGEETENSGENQAIHNVPENYEDVSDYLLSLDYEGEPYVYVNNGTPYFTDEDIAITGTFESYSKLDELGRTQTAFALLGRSLMPAEGEERGSISSIKPSGWVQNKYDAIDNGGWLYNRCHLIAWSLAGENDNEKNLMTGTRYFNVEGMLPFEMQALEYLCRYTENHVLYRATPVYEGDNLLADGLLLEAYSVEDNGELSFCVYLFNVQPGIEIDYATGENQKE